MEVPDELKDLGSNKFHPKLTFDQKMQIMALRLSGVSIGVIAVTFNINRRTVVSMTSGTGTKYRAVKEAVERMGEERVKAHFINEDLLSKVRAAVTDEKAQQSWEEHDGAPPISKVVNPRATRHSGISLYKGQHPIMHRIEVGFVRDKDGYPDGWYAKLLDTGDVNSEEWMGDPDANTHFTSYSALQYAKQYLDENYEVPTNG